jgi:ribonuclease HI
MFLRNIYKQIANAPTWNSRIHLDLAAIAELTWWRDSLTHWNGRTVINKPPEVVLETDASATGWGAVCQQKTASGEWDLEMSAKPSNTRELMAVLLAILTFKQELANKTVLLRSDNITTVACINKLMGVSQDLHMITQAIFNLLQQHQITLTAKYLPGVQNTLADQQSRIVDPFDWELSQVAFQVLDTAWGPHTIDRMASWKNRKTQRYNSRSRDPEAEAVDCFTQTWTLENNFINPPFRLLPQIIQQLRRDKATATIIAPIWPAQPWYQQLTSMLLDKPMIIDLENSFLPGPSQKVEPLRNFKWQIAAFRVSGKLNFENGLKKSKKQSSMHSRKALKGVTMALPKDLPRFATV